MIEDKYIWRWNVNDTWQSFSSMFQEGYLSSKSTSDFERYHHLSSCLLFGACTVESFFNEIYRSKLFNKGEVEKKIFKDLRYTSFRKKFENWPQEICGIKIDREIQEKIYAYLDIRHEVTHRKRKDHSLYSELDNTNPTEFIEAIQQTFLIIYEYSNLAFPYWLLGWNYVGMNSDPTHPCLINNQQFKHSINFMGFSVPAWGADMAEKWEEKFMTTRKGFNLIKSEIYDNAPDIEPKNDRFPFAPRLCKRWWDKSFIINN